MQEQPERSHHRGAPEDEVRRFVIEAARLMHDRHCSEVVVLDVRGLSDVTDYIVIGTGTSERQIDSVATELEDTAKAASVTAMGREQDKPARWVVLDFLDVVVHLFDPPTRGFYDLEMLWGDAKKVDWARK